MPTEFRSQFVVYKFIGPYLNSKYLNLALLLSDWYLILFVCLFVCEYKTAKPNSWTSTCGVFIMWMMVDQSSNLKSEINFGPPWPKWSFHIQMGLVGLKKVIFFYWLNLDFFALFKFIGPYINSKYLNWALLPSDWYLILFVCLFVSVKQQNQTPEPPLLGYQMCGW